MILDLLLEAYEIAESEKDLLERKQVNRTSLRSIKAAGKMTDEQATEVETIYPTITRKRKAKTDNGNV